MGSVNESAAYTTRESNSSSTMSDDELTELLKYPVITDAETVIMMNKKGFSIPVDAKKINTLTLSERFSDHIVNKNMVGRCWNGQFCASGDYEIIVNDKSKVEVLSEYVKIVSPDTPEEECIPMMNCGIKKYRATGKTANAVFTTPYGAKWVVFGFDMWERTVSTEKKNIYLNTAEYISGSRQAAEIITPVKALFQSRINAKGFLTQVSVTNLTVSNMKNVVLRVKHPVAIKAVLMGQYTEETELEIIPTETDGIFEISIPELKPWAVTTIFFEEQ